MNLFAVLKAQSNNSFKEEEARRDSGVMKFIR